MGCKIPRRGEKHPWKISCSRGRCSIWERPRTTALEAKRPQALTRQGHGTTGHQAHTDRGVPGEGYPWNTAGHALRELTEIKFMPSTRRGLPGKARAVGRKQADAPTAGRPGSAPTPRSPFPALGLPDSSQAPQWSLLGELGAGPWAWQAALAVTQIPAGPGGLGGTERDLSSPGKCLEWMWEPKSSPRLEEEPPAP